MKKVLVVGAGAQGGPCASILARDKDVSQIVLGDIDLDLANKVKEKTKSDKVTAVKLDASKAGDIERAAEGVDVIINLVVTWFCSNIMRAALKSGAHYVDASFGEPILTQIMEKRPLEFDAEFKKAGLTALIGCGGSPGVTNVLARYICDKLDHVDGICIRDGTAALKETKEVVGTWEPDWCPERALWGYATGPTIFENGGYKKYPPFSGCEEYYFPELLDSLLIAYHQHQEAITLPRFIGKGTKNVSFKMAIDPIAGALVKLGFGGSDPIDVKGIRVVPKDVLLNLVKHPVEDFLTEDENNAKAPSRFIEPIILEIEGEKSGEDAKYTISWFYSLFANTEEKAAVYRKFGTTNIAVALPAIAGAKMCADGKTESGVIAPECLAPTKFLRMLAEMGWPVKFHEVCSKEMSIS